jgi:phage shock protein PspC (stress-responsive transcriptional regulator)
MTGSAKRCEDVIDRLIAALRKGSDVSAEDRQHVARCPECSRVLAAAGQLEDELAADVPADGDEERLARATREAQAALRLERWRRAAFTVLGAFAVLVPWLMVPKLKLLPADVARTYLMLQIFGALVGLGAVGTLVVQRLNAGTGGMKLYKRLKGQWLFGVCRGLAQAAGLPVAVIRGFLIALMLVGRTGWMIAVPLYLLLDMSLEVHPEDRGLLLRFRLTRWWERSYGSSRRELAGEGTASS